MRLRMVLGVIALLPAAVNAAPVHAGSLALPVCSGDGIVRTVTIPAPSGDIPGREQPGCCAKGCHTGSRKKAASGKLTRDND